MAARRSTPPVPGGTSENLVRGDSAYGNSSVLTACLTSEQLIGTCRLERAPSIEV